MYSNPYVAQQVVTERMKDATRQAEQTRLVRIAAGSKKRQSWRLPMITIKGIRALVIRPHLRHHAKA